MLSLVIWAEVFETYNDLPTELHTVPWYGWANRLGISGLVALPGMVYLIHENRGAKDYYFFAFLFPLSFIIARILHVFPSFYLEDRLTFFMMVPIVLLASYTLLKFWHGLPKRVGNVVRRVLLGSVLSAILIFGLLPALFTMEAVDLNYWSSGTKLTDSELDAFNFLRLNAPSNGSVLTLTDRSERLLSYAGLSEMQTFVNRDPSLVFTASIPEAAIYSLGKSQLKYLYLGSADKKELEQNPSYAGFVRDYLLRFLPIAFQNEEVSIYEIPNFSIPSSSNTALVVTGNSESSTEFMSQVTVALAQIKYSTVLEEDPAVFNHSTLILTDDLNQSNEAGNIGFQKYDSWINLGGDLIVIESSGTWLSSHVFADVLSVYSEGLVEANGIESSTSNLSFPSTITIPIIHSSDSNVKTIASYTINDRPVSGFAFVKNIGEGSVTYLAMSPYFSAIENSTEVCRDLFEDVGSILSLTVPKLEKNTVDYTYYFPQFDLIKTPVNFTGKVSINTDFIQPINLEVDSIIFLLGNEKTKTLRNLTINDVEYDYPAKFSIDASQVYLTKSGLGTYSNLEIIGDFNLTIDNSGNGSVSMSIWYGGSLEREVFNQEVITLGIKSDHNTSILVNSPSIEVDGEAFFGKARIYRNYYKMPLFFDDGDNAFKVTGRTKLRIQYSDKGLSFVDNFSFNGTWFYPKTGQEQESSFTEFEIPWFSVLTSPFHILLLSVVCGLTIVNARLTLKKNKQDNNRV
jgi:hypothetical protein